MSDFGPAQRDVNTHVDLFSLSKAGPRSQASAHMELLVGSET